MLASIEVKGVVEAPPYLITADLHKDVLWITQLKKKKDPFGNRTFSGIRPSGNHILQDSVLPSDPAKMCRVNHGTISAKEESGPL